MDYHLTYSPRALQRLHQIVRRIAQDDPAAAARVGNRLLGQTELLRAFPELGAPYTKRPGLRRLTCKPYLIFYRVRHAQQQVEILDIWHAAQQEPPL